MSFNGYVVENAGTQLNVDLSGSSFAPGTDVIIYPLNQANGTRNQNWRVIPVNAGTNLFTIQSVLTGLYAVASGGSAAGSQIKSAVASQPWQIAVIDTYSRNYVIKEPNTNLVWSVAAGSGATTVITLAVATNNNTNQQWIFKAVA